MSKSSHSKIFIVYGGNICDFMWANTTKDGTVIIGMTETGKSTTSVIWDSKLGELTPGAFIEAPPLENPKISFHPSGLYKMATRIGISANAIDRCTVVGKPLSEIDEPRRMMEVLIPDRLRISEVKPTEHDIVLDATLFPKRPLRCTVSCMSATSFYNMINSHKRFVDTSDIESTGALETGSQIWTFTLRSSRNDTQVANIYHIMVQGDIRWGRIIDESEIQCKDSCREKA